MAEKMTFGVGAHEPIFHRLRTGNANATEWERWERETSIENLDLLEELGVARAHIPCTKGFGLEYEKPLIERAAKFAEEAAKRGIVTDVYVQGFPVYYETFLAETPEAVDWLARDQDGRFIPWGCQTFRRWMDPTSEPFLEYQLKMFEYILSMVKPHHFMMDNTRSAPCYTDSSRASWKKYLQDKFTPEEAYKEFGINTLEAIDLPIFDPIYYPMDAFQIVKDPIMQEWTFWRSKITDDFLEEIKTKINSLAPDVLLYSPCGCEGLRYNHYFRAGINFERRIDLLDQTGMEESSWRPGVIESAQEHDLEIVMDERVPDAAAAKEAVELRISTNARWAKIIHNYEMKEGGHGFWGETNREAKLVALAHGLCFSPVPHKFGSIGPLCAHAEMADDIKDIFEWGTEHIDILAGRDKRFSPVAVWRSTNTNAFIRHRPIWEALVTEQMLFEHHIPFDILLDNGLERFLDEKQVLILPGSACVSREQIDIITNWVEKGGNLLLLGHAGTRDQRTRVRTEHAFAHLFGEAMPNLEQIGPPHWVPSLDFSKMPDELITDYGKGKAALVKKVQERFPLDMTRDVYMPERQVFVKDIIPPANEDQILKMVNELYPLDALRMEGDRWVLAEYWKKGSDLLIGLANIRRGHASGKLTVKLGDYTAEEVQMHTLLESEIKTVPVKDGCIELDGLEHFCMLVVKGVL